MLVIQSDLRFPFLNPIFSSASLALGGARLQEKSQELNAQVAPAEKSRPLASSGEFFFGTFSIIYLHNVPICGTYNYIYIYIYVLNVLYCIPYGTILMRDRDA